MPTAAFVLNHPAHYHLFRNTIAELRQRGWKTPIGIRPKDVLKTLLNGDNEAFIELAPSSSRRRHRSSILMSAIRAYSGKLNNTVRWIRCERPNLLLGTDVTIAHAGRLCGIPSLVFNEDDLESNPWFGWAAYPAATHIISPRRCSVGRFEYKRVAYDGYQKLAYLHPARFISNQAVVDAFNPRREPFALLRLVSLTAIHDVGKRGIDLESAMAIIQRLETRVKVFVTSETELPSALSPYRPPFSPQDIHHVLSNASLLVTDGQSMAVEAAMLGTPSVRSNDFVGRTAVLEDLEFRYRLTRGVPPSDRSQLLPAIDEMLELGLNSEERKRRREALLANSIDVTGFFTELVDQYPKSIAHYREGRMGKVQNQ